MEKKNEFKTPALEELIEEIVDRVEEQTGDKLVSPDYLGCIFPPDGGKV